MLLSLLAIVDVVIVELLLRLGELVPEQYRVHVVGLFAAWAGMSLLVGEINAWVRRRTEAGARPLPPRVLKFFALLNLVAMNADKARQLWAGYRGPSMAPGALRR